MNGVALIAQRDGGVWHAKAAAAAAHASGPSLTTAPATRATTARPDCAAADRQNLAKAPPPRGRRLWTLPLPLRRAGPIPSCLSIAAAARDTPPVLTLRGRPHGHSAITALLPARAEFIMLPFPSRPAMLIAHAPRGQPGLRRRRCRCRLECQWHAPRAGRPPRAARAFLRPPFPSSHRYSSRAGPLTRAASARTGRQGAATATAGPCAGA